MGSLKDIKLNFCFTAKININTKKYTLSSSPIGKKNINNTNLYDKINGVINNSFDDLLKDKISQEDKDLINSNLFNIYDKYSIQPITRNSQSNIKLDRRRDFTQIFNNESNKSYCKTCSTYSNKTDYNQTMNLIDQKLQGICEETNKFDFQNFILEEKINVNIYGKSDKQPEFIFKDNEIIRLENYGDDLNILKPIASIGATGTGFIYYYQDTSQPWDVEQEDSLDKVDRVAFAITKIKKIVQENLNERTQS